jgi:hypothetical protein
MLDVQARLKDMGKGSVTDIVQQGGGEERISAPTDLAILSTQVAQRQLHQVQYTEGVTETAVVSPRISEVTDAELVYATQALDFSAIQQVKQPLVRVPIDANVVV